jgi:hypothetical protein
MKKIILIGMTALLPWAVGAIPSFPGAEGYGSDTPGGRGGKVLIVTNTNASGPGSFFWALAQPGPRIIVFRTSGVITLAPSAFEPNGPYSNVTIAGQTSPGGVTIRGRMTASGSIWWCYNKCNPAKGGSLFHDAILRFIRFRGDQSNEDAFTMTYSHDFVIDHCDFSGGADETLDLSHTWNYTIQWCTVSNAPLCSGCQTYGTLIQGSDVRKITMHHNYHAHFIGRGGPCIHWGDADRATDDGMFDYINNICYNARDFSLRPPLSAYWVPTVKVKTNIIGNTFKDGSATPDGYGIRAAVDTDVLDLYDRDNVWVKTTGDSLAYNFSGTAAMRHTMPLVTTQNAEDAYQSVLAKAGAWPRDAMNTRTVGEIRNQTGLLGKNNDLLIQAGPEPPADTDADGMADDWERQMGLNPSDGTDHSGDHDGDGYLNIEEYINDVALARLCEDYHNPPYPIPSDWPDYNPACCRSLALESGASGENLRHGLFAVQPNPYTGSGKVLFRATGPIREGNVAVLDIRGRRLREWRMGREIAWDGRDRRGRAVPAGIYLVHWIDVSGLSGQDRIAVVR